MIWCVSTPPHPHPQLLPANIRSRLLLYFYFIFFVCFILFYFWKTFFFSAQNCNHHRSVTSWRRRWAGPTLLTGNSNRPEFPFCVSFEQVFWRVLLGLVRSGVGLSLFSAHWPSSMLLNWSETTDLCSSRYEGHSLVVSYAAGCILHLFVCLSTVDRLERRVHLMNWSLFWLLLLLKLILSWWWWCLFNKIRLNGDKTADLSWLRTCPTWLDNQTKHYGWLRNGLMRRFDWCYPENKKNHKKKKKKIKLQKKQK